MTILDFIDTHQNQIDAHILIAQPWADIDNDTRILWTRNDDQLTRLAIDEGVEI